MKILLHALLTFGFLFFLNSIFAQSEAMKEQEIINMQKTAVLITNVEAGTFQVQLSQSSFEETLSKKQVISLCDFIKKNRPKNDDVEKTDSSGVTVHIISEKKILEGNYEKLPPFIE